MSHLSEMLRLYIKVNDVEQKALCQEIGIGESTLTRFLQGTDMSTSNFVKLMGWLATDTHKQGGTK